MKRAIRRLSLVLLLAALLSGCQTVRSWQHGCADVYSGTRYYGEIRHWVPLDGKIFFALDLPFTLLADTLALPVTAWLEPEEPREGWSRGCRWARR